MTNQELWEIANRERLWMTAEEFYAYYEAHKAARLKAIPKLRKPLQRGPFYREYRLWDGNWIFEPEVKTPIASKLEVMP
jgi:hypothetical protein